MNNKFIFNLHIVKKYPNKSISLNENLHVKENDLVNFMNNLISKGYRFVSLDEFIQNVKVGLKSKFVAFTVDDGHPDTLRILNKLSFEMKVPFCFYLTTDFMSGKYIPWWEILDFLVLENDYLTFNFTRIENKNKTQKVNNFMKLRETFMTLDMQTFLELISTIFPNTSEILDSFPIKSYKLDTQDLYDFKKNPFFTFGSHSVSHRLLTKLTDEELVFELIQSKELLESLLNRQVVHFSYPYGHHYSFNSKVISSALEAGYISAVTTNFSRINPNSLMELPRIDLTTKLATQSINRTLLSVSYPYMTKTYSKLNNLFGSIN